MTLGDVIILVKHFILMSQPQPEATQPIAQSTYLITLSPPPTQSSQASLVVPSMENVFIQCTYM